MKTLLVILSYPKANGIVLRHLPWYQKSGCDIYGIGTLGGACQWPERAEGFIGFADIGLDSYVNGAHLPRKLIDVLIHLLSSRMLAEYDAFCLTEPDAIFPRALPNRDKFTPGLIATYAGGPQTQRGFMASRYYHGPWWMDRATARQMVKCGEAMLRLGLIEHGFPDFFIGLMADLYDLPVHHGQTFSVNAIDSAHYVQAARKAIANGVYYVHGIKTEQQLIQVTNP